MHNRRLVDSIWERLAGSHPFEAKTFFGTSTPGIRTRASLRHLQNPPRPPTNYYSARPSVGPEVKNQMGRIYPAILVSLPLS